MRGDDRMRVGFYSTMYSVPWGASEELWSQTAVRLLGRGHSVAVNYQWWPTLPAGLRRIVDAGGSVFLRGRPRHGADRILRGIRRRVRRRIGAAEAPEARWLRDTRPDLVLVSLGSHLHDPGGVALACQSMAIPYAINLQVASAYAWIDAALLERFRRLYLGAQQCFVLSDENRDIIETQLGLRLDRSCVVDNPLKVNHDAVQPYPDAGTGWRLAVVGRLHAVSKGQDLVLKVVSRERWRRSPVKVIFWGEDAGSERLLRALVDAHGLGEMVEFGGVSADIEALWRAHHGLLLPSRFEGLPVVTVEAMMCGRVPIVTRCGRNGDLVDDNETGFLAASPTVEAVEEALSRAWARREEWERLGALAAVRVRERYSRTPVDDFTHALEDLARPK